MLNILFSDNTEEAALELIKFIQELITRVRKLVKIARKASLLREHIADWAKEQLFQCRALLLDFKIRWNTIYLMLERLLKFKEVIEQITASPGSVEGVSNKQQSKLKSLRLSAAHWSMVIMLESLLAPFFQATKILSGSNYKTSSLAYVLKNALTTIYTQEHITISDKESLLKAFILEKINFYFNKHFSYEGEANILVILIFY